MTPQRLLVALALVCAVTIGTSTAVGADVVGTDEVEPVVLYVTDIPDDDPDGGLIVRSGPSTGTRQIDVLDNDTAVTAVSWPVTGFFVEISSPVEGWVGVKYLTVEKPEQRVRQIDAQNARPAGSTSDEVEEADDAADAEGAPETLALDDNLGPDRRTRPSRDSDSGGFPIVPVGVGLLVVAAVGGASMRLRSQ